MSTISSIIGAYMGSESQEDAAETSAQMQQSIADKNIALTREIYEQNRADLAPFREIELAGARTGLKANEQLYNEISGGFEQSPSYQWNLDQGIKSLDKSALSGGVSKNADAMNYASGLASNEYQNYLNTLKGLSGVNTGYATSAATNANQYAGQIAGINTDLSNNLANYYLSMGQNTANLWNQVGQSGSNALSDYLMYSNAFGGGSGGGGS